MSGEAANWKDLEASLLGAFSARAKGFRGSEFSLLGRDGWVLGTLRLEGSGASFEARGMEGRVEASGSRSRMFIGGEEILSAERGRSGLRIEAGGMTFDASVSPFRNTAKARTSESEEVARVSGGISNRRYDASFEGENLAVAILLLHHLAATRRRAFRAG